MSELISGKEALIALANGDCVEYTNYCTPSWHDLAASGISINEIVDPKFNKFRLKPKIILINNIEVPAPFEPVGGDTFYYLSTEDECGYDYKSFVDSHPYFDGDKIQFGAWRNEDEIKQVITALRLVFEIK